MRQFIVCFKKEYLLWEKIQSLHCRIENKTVQNLVTKCVQGLGYFKKHKKLAMSIHLLLMQRIWYKEIKELGEHAYQKVVGNKNAGDQVDKLIRRDRIIKNSKPDLFMHDQKKKWDNSDKDRHLESRSVNWIKNEKNIKYS